MENKIRGREGKNVKGGYQKVTMTSDILKRFNTEVIGSNDIIYDFLPKIAAVGEFKRLQNIDVIISSWNNILLTPKRTYLHDPEYGSDLFKLIFEPVDSITIERIKNEIVLAIRRYDNRAEIDDIIITLLTSKKGFSVDVHINYQGEKGRLTMKFDDSTFLTTEKVTGS